MMSLVERPAACGPLTCLIRQADQHGRLGYGRQKMPPQPYGMN
jgi:hypothetical protein